MAYKLDLPYSRHSSQEERTERRGHLLIEGKLSTQDKIGWRTAVISKSQNESPSFHQARVSTHEARQRQTKHTMPCCKTDCPSAPTSLCPLLRHSPSSSPSHYGLFPPEATIQYKTSRTGSEGEGDPTVLLSTLLHCSMATQTAYDMQHSTTPRLRLPLPWSQMVNLRANFCHTKRISLHLGESEPRQRIHLKACI